MKHSSSARQLGSDLDSFTWSSPAISSPTARRKQLSGNNNKRRVRTGPFLHRRSDGGRQPYQCENDPRKQFHECSFGLGLVVAGSDECDTTWYRFWYEIGLERRFRPPRSKHDRQRCKCFIATQSIRTTQHKTWMDPASRRCSTSSTFVQFDAIAKYFGRTFGHQHEWVVQRIA